MADIIHDCDNTGASLGVQCVNEIVPRPVSEVEAIIEQPVYARIGVEADAQISAQASIGVGPAGPTGPAGPAGPAGPQGPSGMTIEVVPASEWPPADPVEEVLYLKGS